MNGQSVDERVRNTLLWTLNSKWGPPRALDLHHGVRRVWSPFTGKLGQFPPPCASGGRREGAHLQHPNFSDLSFLPGLQRRAEVPRRGEVGGAVTAPGTPQRLPSPPCGCVPFLGDSALGRGRRGGEGSARGGEKRLYSSEEGLGANARLRDNGRPEAARAASSLPASPRSPRVSPARGTGHCAPGGALRSALRAARRSARAPEGTARTFPRGKCWSCR